MQQFSESKKFTYGCGQKVSSDTLFFIERDYCYFPTSFPQSVLRDIYGVIIWP